MLARTEALHGFSDEPFEKQRVVYSVFAMPYFSQVIKQLQVAMPTGQLEDLSVGVKQHIIAVVRLTQLEKLQTWLKSNLKSRLQQQMTPICH